MSAGSKFLLGLLHVVPFIALVAIKCVMSISFERNVGGYLERAANANTIELAEREVRTALSSITERKLTSGYTSIIYRTPNEDIGYWYKNINAAHKELIEAQRKSQLSQLEASNVLMKLRETLLDKKEGGEIVTTPPGIVMYPHNTFFAFGFTFAALLAVCGIVLFCDSWESL
jgi:hypothetical protein